MSFYSLDQEIYLTIDDEGGVNCDLCKTNIRSVYQNALCPGSGLGYVAFAYLCEECNESLKTMRKRNQYGGVYLLVEEYEDWKAIVNYGEDVKEPECK